MTLTLFDVIDWNENSQKFQAFLHDLHGKKIFIIWLCHLHCIPFNQHLFQITKIDHHRGPVTGLQVSHISDVLVSASHDAAVCLWSLDDFTLLNTIQLNSPILSIQISSDSVSRTFFFSSFRFFSFCKCHLCK